MRDPNNTAQRRRRLRLLQTDGTESFPDDPVELTGLPHGEPSAAVVGDDTARNRFFVESQGRTGLELLVEVSGQAHSRKIELDQPYLLIGRDNLCDLRIDHSAVHSRQVYLQWINGQLFGCSLDSTDQKPVTAWVQRKPVSFGALRISVPDIETAGAADPQARSSELAEEVPQVQLKFAGVEQRDNLWPVDRNLTLIGRGPQCKLRLDHPDVSHVMAALVRTPIGCWLVNLSAASGLRVNDRQIVVESLDIGDTIQLGPFRAEVSVAPFSLKAAQPARHEARNAIRELAGQHRQRLGALNQSLSAVQVYLDSEHLDGVPELKMALQQYVLHAQRHHREMQDALERLATH